MLSAQPEFGASLPQLFLAALPSFLFGPIHIGPIHIGYHSREIFFKFSQLCDVIGQDGVGADGLYGLRILASRRFELNPVPVILCSLVSQCL